MIVTLLRAFAADRRGATAIEYGLIAALVVVVLLVGLTAFGNETTAMWATVDEAIVGADGEGGE